MRKLRHVLALLAAALLAGCVLFPGTIEEGLPKLRDRLPETTRVYLPSPLNPRGGFLYTRNAQIVAQAFKGAFERRGIAVTMPERRSGAQPTVLAQARSNGCDVVLFTQIQRWDYGEAGFSGFGGRDEVTLGVTLMDVAKERVLTRATIYVRNGIGRSPPGGNDDPAESVTPILDKYVESLFPERQDR